MLLRYDSGSDRDGDVQGCTEKDRRREGKEKGRRGGEKRVEMMILGWQRAVNSRL